MFKDATAFWLLPLLLFTGIVQAQTKPPRAQKSESHDAPAYRSVFENYIPYGDDKLLDWKEANRQVERRGGWRQYAKEAQEPEPKLAPTTRGANPASDSVSPKPKP